MIISETSAARQMADSVFLTLMVASLDEEDNVAATLDTVIEALQHFNFTREIIVIDDGSTDQSQAVVRRYLKGHDDIPLKLVSNGTNEGLAQTYINGAFFGRGESTGWCAATMSSQRKRWST